ncbi:hypothetical protein J4476_01420 [Candidatus Woesearchaeota archaeon]|nr:MAG: hypothetical protein QT09_C0012G0078 [archaeon GW2011_AR18]MBS3161337.1 hypothetical protein [Candidatus Woesearchaeota archaeon]HIH25368.1 hypothetical protein [Nanoarchaeota archaeon]
MKIKRTSVVIVARILLATTPVKADENYQIRDLAAYIQRNDGTIDTAQDGAVSLEEHMFTYITMMTDGCKNKKGIYGSEFYRLGICKVVNREAPDQRYANTEEIWQKFIEREGEEYTDYDIDKDGRITLKDDLNQDNKIDDEDRKLHEWGLAQR